MGRLTGFYRFATPYRRRNGLLGGLLVAAELRQDYKLAPGQRYRVHLPTLAHPVTLRAGTSDAEVFRQLLVQRELRIPGSPRFIVDAGANIGLAAVLFAARYPEATVVALEADPDNFRMLQENVKHYPRVVAQQRALWSRRTTLALSNPLGKHSTVRVGEGDPAGGLEVEAVGVNDLMAEFGATRVDVLKMDIEGAEAEVLGQGSAAWIGSVGTMIVELHDRYRPDCSSALERCLEGLVVEREQSGEYDVVRFAGTR